MTGLPRVFDGHNDTLLDLMLPERGGDRSFFERSSTGHLDLPRARAGGYAGGFFAIFVPNEETAETKETADGYEVPLADAVPHERAKACTYDALELIYRLERHSDGAFRIGRTLDDLRTGLGRDTVTAVIHLEGAEAVAPDRSNLDFLYAAGVRSIGLTWSRPNEFGTGVPFAFPRSPDTGPGLTNAGVELIQACNDRGILVDLAHLSEQGFWDAADCSEAPLVVSHAAVHELCPSTRNLTNEQLDAIGASGGVVGINFCAETLHPGGEQDTALPRSTLIDHIEFIVDRIGIDHVAIGSDFDGATVPDVVGDVTHLPSLLEAIRARGFDDADLRKIAHENWLRVLDATWR